MTEESVIGYRLFKSLRIMVSHPIKVSRCAPLDQETKDSKIVGQGERTSINQKSLGADESENR